MDIEKDYFNQKLEKNEKIEKKIPVPKKRKKNKNNINTIICKYKKNIKIPKNKVSINKLNKQIFELKDKKGNNFDHKNFGFNKLKDFLIILLELNIIN